MRDRGIGKHCARKGDRLLFAGGKAVAAFANVALVPFFKSVYDTVGEMIVGAASNFFIGRRPACRNGCFPEQRPERQMGILQHIANIAVAATKLRTLAQSSTVRRSEPGRSSAQKSGMQISTMVDFPAPVSPPTMAIVLPCGTFRLKCSSTFSPPSG